MAKKDSFVPVIDSGKTLAEQMNARDKREAKAMQNDPWEKDKRNVERNVKNEGWDKHV